jgi:hypothetical protein
VDPDTTLRCALCGVDLMPSHGYLPSCPNTTDGYHVNNIRWVYVTPQQKQQLQTGTSPGAVHE